MSVIIDRKTIIGPTSNPALVLSFNNTSAPSATLEEWNNLFVYSGNPFTSVEIVENDVLLRGGSNITLNPSLVGETFAQYMTGIVDNANCIIDSRGIAFLGPNGIQTVNLPALTTTGIFGGLCLNCYSLTTVNLPSLTNATDSDFKSCYSLTTVNLPSLVTAGQSSFEGCTSLTTINLPSLQIAGQACFVGVGSTSILPTVFNLPSLEVAGNGCFSYCSNLISINLPSLQTAEAYCFDSCYSLTTINLPLLVAPDGLGGQPAYNSVFANINIDQQTGQPTNNPINITIPAAFQTNYNGDYDGDLQYLINYATVNITPV